MGKAITAEEAIKNFQNAAHEHELRRVSYEQGYEQGIEEFAARLKKYYSNLRGTSLAVLTAYHIEEAKKELLKELLKEEENND